MTDGKVVIGYIHPDEISAGFHNSFVNLIVYDMNGPHRLAGGGGWIARHSSAAIVQARNAIVRSFLYQTSAEWLLLLDADMTFQPNLVDALLEAADPVSAPIVGGLCFGHDNGQLFPTLYQLFRDGDSEPYFDRYKTFPDNGMLQVSATGAACLLIHRTVLEKVHVENPEPYPWFQELALRGEPLGEDLAFCLRAGKAGFPIHVHTGIRIGHVKTQVLTHDMYEAQQRGSLDGSD